MDILSQPVTLIGSVGLIVLISLVAMPRRATIEGFYGGLNEQGAAPGLWVLVFSQVTTWIFARSLMNAAILGYYYGIWGTLAYTAYYGSFLTGGYIVGRVRARGGRSVQDYLGSEFGTVGTACYNVVIALRLLSEVFANLLVIGLIAQASLPDMPTVQWIGIVGFAALALAYSAHGGLHASLRTDVVQMSLFLVVFAVALPALFLLPDFSFSAVMTAKGTSGPTPGLVLLVVAFLQVFSYPAHDPVMMDRGFLSDPKTARQSFFHAFWISALCIFLFGLFGVQAGVIGAAYEQELLVTWQKMFGPGVYFLIVLTLLVSALSTLDSALASAARLTVEELKLAPRSMNGGRVAMVVFAVAGTALTLTGSKTLFDAVAISGTASMFLTPVLVTTLVLGRRLALWAYVASFAAALAGAVLYLFNTSAFAAAILPEAHKYTQLLYICIAVLVVGFVVAALGSGRRDGVAARG
jgi:Na+/proline symporter